MRISPLTAALAAIALTTACTDPDEIVSANLADDGSIAFQATIDSKAWADIAADTTRSGEIVAPAQQQSQRNKQRRPVRGLDEPVRPGDIRLLDDDLIVYCHESDDWDVQPQDTADTRAAHDIITTSNASSMAVWAMKDSDHSYLFTNVTANKGSDNIWRQASTHHLWPTDSSLRFFAKTPATPSNTSNTFSISTPSSTSAWPTITYNDYYFQDDLCIAASGSCTQKSPASLTFKHVLSAIKVSFAPGTYKYTIKSIALSSVKYNGTLQLTANSTSGSSGFSGTWSLNSSTAGETYSANKYIPFEEYSSTSVAPSGQACFFVMPQTLPSGAKLTITYTEYGSTTNKTLTVPISGTLEMGKVYNYEISVFRSDFEMDIDFAKRRANSPRSNYDFSVFGQNFSKIDGEELSYDMNYDYVIDYGHTDANGRRARCVMIQGQTCDQAHHIFPSGGQYTIKIMCLSKAIETFRFDVETETILDEGGETYLREHDGTQYLDRNYLVTAVRNVTGVPFAGQRTYYNSEEDWSIDYDSTYKLFYLCGNLKNVPVNVFGTGCTMKNFESCFEGCKNLKSTPTGLFPASATSFYRCFKDCTALSNIVGSAYFSSASQVASACAAASPFAKCTNATSFAYCFQNCTKLMLSSLVASKTWYTSQDADDEDDGSYFDWPESEFLFYNCTNATSFEGCFMNSGLRVADYMFGNNKKATNFQYCFKNCSMLNISNAIFLKRVGYGTVDSDDNGYSYTYWYSTGLETISQHFSYASSSSLNFAECFAFAGWGLRNFNSTDWASYWGQKQYGVNNYSLPNIPKLWQVQSKIWRYAGCFYGVNIRAGDFKQIGNTNNSSSWSQPNSYYDSSTWLSPVDGLDWVSHGTRYSYSTYNKYSQLPYKP